MTPATLKRGRLSSAVRALGYATLLLLLPTTVEAAHFVDPNSPPTCTTAASVSSETFSQTIANGGLNQLLVVDVSDTNSTTISRTLSASTSWSTGAVQVKAAALGSFAKLQLLLPGETAAPGTASVRAPSPAETAITFQTSRELTG